MAFTPGPAVLLAVSNSVSVGPSRGHARLLWQCRRGVHGVGGCHGRPRRGADQFRRGIYRP
ncbi:hypothetical protein ACU4GD_40575 [Cupriavidus basilensis]